MIGEYSTVPSYLHAQPAADRTSVTASEEEPTDNFWDSANVIHIKDIRREGIIDLVARHMFFWKAKSPEIFAMEGDGTQQEDEAMDKRRMILEDATDLE